MDDQTSAVNFSIDRLPKDLQDTFRDLYANGFEHRAFLPRGDIYQGDARELLKLIEPNSIALSVWSPPYFVGKNYEADLTFTDWQELLREVIRLHFSIIQPGGFVVINIADILVFKDSAMPKVQADVVHNKRSPVTREDVLQAMTEHPDFNRYQLAKHFGCSEQTVDRRLHGNNIRGGKYSDQTRLKIVGGLIEEWGLAAGFYMYDRRVWVKDAAWENSRWASLSYRSVDEFEYLYFLWKPGITTYDRRRLAAEDWRDWGSRAVWSFPSVRSNDDHEAKFPIELPSRVLKLLTDPGDTVLDCFMGSGTTAAAAIREEREFIGFELHEPYVQIARARIADERERHNNRQLSFEDLETTSQIEHFSV